MTQSKICQTTPCGNGVEKCIEISILGYFVNFTDPCNDEATEKNVNDLLESQVIPMINAKVKLQIPGLEISNILGGIVSDNDQIKSGSALRVTLLNELSEPFTEEYYHEEWEQQFLWYINNLTEKVSIHF